MTCLKPWISSASSVLERLLERRALGEGLFELAAQLVDGLGDDGVQHRGGKRDTLR